MKKLLTTSLCVTACISTFLPITHSVFAEVSPNIPHTLIYEGRLLSKTSQKLQGDYTMRFSLWKTTDIQDDEIDETTGALNTEDPDFGHWSEEIPVHFTEQGYFSVILGEQQVFTDILLANHKYLQVEIKKGLADEDNDNEYQVLDVDVLDDTKDRKLVSSLPYAFNSKNSNYSKEAEKSSASLGNVFVIDPDNSVEEAETGEIKLQFGQMLAKIIAYNYDRKLFTINDSVEITGNLSLQSETGSVTFSPDNMVGNNTYILPDSDSSDADATVDETFVLVDTKTTQELENKTIDANKNTIINLDTSSLNASAKTKTIAPLFPNATFEANTTNNQVSIFMGNEEDGTITRQYYKISTDTTDNSLHTGKLLLTLHLDEFESFDTTNGKITFYIKTSSLDTAQNSVDIKIKDTDGSLFSSLENQVSSNAWKAVEIDLSSIDISNSSILSDKNIQIELDFSVSGNNTVYISNITTEYKGK